MPIDSEPIRAGGNTHDDIMSMIMGAVGNMQWKFFIILFAVLIFANTDVFTDRIMSKFTNAVEGRTLTNWGTFIQIFMVIGILMVFDVLIKQGILG